MAKILKSDSAPDGDLRVSIGNEAFEVGASGFETDDRVLLSEAERHPFLRVEHADGTPDERALAEHERIEAEKDRRGEAEIQRAEKDPMDDPMTVEVEVPGPDGTERDEQVPVSDSQEKM